MRKDVIEWDTCIAMSMNALYLAHPPLAVSIQCEYMSGKSERLKVLILRSARYNNERAELSTAI